MVADTAKTSKGFLSLKAYRLTPMTIQLYKSGDFTADNIKDLKVTHDSLFEEVPIVIKNSHLVNELLLELSEQIPIEAGCQFLDLGTAGVLEEQLKYLIVSVDELNQVLTAFSFLVFDIGLTWTLLNGRCHLAGFVPAKATSTSIFLLLRPMATPS